MTAIALGAAALVNLWALTIWGWAIIPTFLYTIGRLPSDYTRLGLLTLGAILACHRLYWELRPLYLPAAAIDIAYRLNQGHTSVIAWLFHLAEIIIWFLPFGHDDRWRRRRRKARDKIRQLANGRLTTQPAPANT